MTGFMDDFKARVVRFVVPADAPKAHRVVANVGVDAATQYAGEMDESTDATITATVTGYDEDGKQLWCFGREYGEMTGYDRKDPSAPYGLMRLIADLDEVAPAAPDMTQPPAYKTETASKDGPEYRGGFPG